MEVNSAQVIGRVGSLAVALGVGAAVFTGTGTAWATEESDGGSSAAGASVSESASPTDAGSPSGKRGAAGDEDDADPDVEESRDAEDTEDTEDSRDTEDTEEADVAEADDELPDPDTAATLPVDTEDDPTPTEPAGTDEAAEPKRALPRTDDAAEGIEETESAPARRPQAVSVTAEAVAEHPDIAGSIAVTQESSSDAPPTPSVVTTTVAPPEVPSWRPWPTAYDLRTAVTYVVDLVSSFVEALLQPFVSKPAAPSADPAEWALVAWIRREFFNQRPTPVENPLPYTQSLTLEGDVVVTGAVGFEDRDGDPLSYTVIGRPHNGGTVHVDQNGDFIYRPMNAMAAVGGTDSFTVVVSDERAGLQIGGLLGLLKFVPILGPLLYPGGGHRVAHTVTVTVDPVEGVDLSLPDGFRWGVAHSGFQAEGGPGSPVDTNSDWYRWVHDPLNQLLGLVNGVPEDGPGAYVSYENDADLARDELGVNTFRMGIEWSRIFPNSTAAIDISDEGGGVSLADLQALDTLANLDEVGHYRAVFDALRLRGLDPMVTVNHFTLPVWVHDPIVARPLIQLGLPAPAAGWLSSSTPEEFEKYAAYVAWKFGDQVDNWVTVNEPFPPVLTELLAIPWVVPNWPPGVTRPDLASTFVVNQAIGHVAAYDAIHAWDTESANIGGPAAFVGFAHNMIPARPANPVSLLDVQAADAWNHYYNQWFPNAVIDGWVDVNFDGIKTANEVFADFVGKVDFLGVQYYGSQPMIGFGVAPVPGFPFLRGFPIRCQASPTCSDFNQPTDPGGFREVLELAASYGKPLWITENGIADADDSKRPSYIVNHISVVQDLASRTDENGVDIRGYTYWSFVDNLEWSEGYDLKFGLYGSDPNTPELERTPKPDSIAALSGITTANGLPLWLLGQYVPNAVTT